jgi:hypothetical protein
VLVTDERCIGSFGLRGKRFNLEVHAVLFASETPRTRIGAR